MICAFWRNPSCSGFLSIEAGELSTLGLRVLLRYLATSILKRSTRFSLSEDQRLLTDESIIMRIEKVF
jgi:hypothetical protein